MYFLRHAYIYMNIHLKDVWKLEVEVCQPTSKLIHEKMIEVPRALPARFYFANKSIGKEHLLNRPPFSNRCKFDDGIENNRNMQFDSEISSFLRNSLD